MPGARSTTIPIAVSAFGLGCLAIVSVFALYATGRTDLPLWLNLATLLAPVGLITGVLAVIVRAVRSRRTTTDRPTSDESGRA